MSEIGIDTLITLVLGILGSLGSTLPFVAKFKTKLNQAKALVIAIDSALEDDRISKAELKIIARHAREIIGTKKV